VNSILLAIFVLLVAAVLSIALSARSRVSASVGALLATVGCGCGAWGSVRGLASANAESLSVGWSIPNAALSVGIDPLSAFFLCPLFVLGGLSACYGRAYLSEHSPKRNLAAPWAAYNILLAAMALVVVARNAMFFLFAWEVMSLAGFLLVSFEHEDASVRRASFVYLIAAHVGVTCLFAVFLLLGSRVHSFEFDAMLAMARPSAAFAGVVFLLALIGFGAKAGIFPLHVWLPEAHAAAPTHVSALMSGVLIKMGLYGILRVVLLLGGPRPYWGQLLMVLGLAGGAVGIGCSLYQRDIKRLLAYSSVENVGLILLGLGIAMWAATSNRPLIAAFGLFAGLLHIWNHALMKGSMFLAAGSLAHRCHSRDLERFGGLARRMPQTAAVLLVGATAMAGLPPLNGFVSECLLYLGLLRATLAVEGRSLVAVIAAIAVVSLIGAMAAVSFTRMVGVALLGTARTPRAEAAKESSFWMTAPMLLLALGLIGLALTPKTFASLLAPVAHQLFGSTLVVAEVNVGLSQIGMFNIVVAAVLAVGVGVAVLLQTNQRASTVETWGCGYTAPTSRIQYTGRGFSELFTSSILPRSFGPRLSTQTLSGFFPESARFESECVDPVTRGVYEPFFERWASRFVRLRFMQQGILQIYVLYILVTLLFALTWSVTMGTGVFR
jgi:hydrogenase-4 component B